MPAGLVKDMARRYGLEVSTVEGFWRRCKSEIGEKYGLVVNCTKAKCREAKKK